MKKIIYIFLVMSIFLLPKQILAAETKKCIYTGFNTTAKVEVEITSTPHSEWEGVFFHECSAKVTGFPNFGKIEKSVDCGLWEDETKAEYDKRLDECPYTAIVGYKKGILGADDFKLILTYTIKKDTDIHKNYEYYELGAEDIEEFVLIKPDDCSKYTYNQCLYNTTDKNGNECIRNVETKTCRKKISCEEYATKDACPVFSDFGRCEWTNNKCSLIGVMTCPDYGPSEPFCPEYDMRGKKCTWTGKSCEYKYLGDDPHYEEDDDDVLTGKATCKVMFSGEFGVILGELFDLLKFAVPILIIGMSVIEYVKAVASHNQDDVKKATSLLIKRLIIGLIIFLLPTLIEFLLGIAGYGINDGHCFDWVYR